MIVLLGAGGYIGKAMGEEMIRKNGHFALPHHAVLDFRYLEQYLRHNKPEILISCAAYIPKPSVLLCDQHKAETIMGNVAFVQMVTDACEATGTPLMHLSTGCLFDERTLYAEEDKPIRGFDGHCGFYVGTKLLAEDIVRRYEKHYILRLRLPFDEFDNPRNYLSKLAHYATEDHRINDHLNSLSHRGDFCKAALDLWTLRAPYGTYHVTNPGVIPAREVMTRLFHAGIARRFPEMVPPGETFGSTLSVDKLLKTGVKIRDVNEAVYHAIKNWKPCINP